MTEPVCALCGESRECLEKEIDSMLYDICPGCWSQLAEKLQGKGRRAQESVTVVAPAAPAGAEDEKPFPGKPPKVWLSASSKQTSLRLEMPEIRSRPAAGTYPTART